MSSIETIDMLETHVAYYDDIQCQEDDEQNYRENNIDINGDGFFNDL